MEHLQNKLSTVLFGFEKRSIGFFFLGVGVTVFVLNFLGMFQLLPYLASLVTKTSSISFVGYIISVSSSLLLVFFSGILILKSNER